MTLKDVDKFIVNRSSQSFQVNAKNLMAKLRDDDLMLVNRYGQSFKATGKDIKDSLTPSNIPPVLDSVGLVESNPGADPRFTDQEFVITTTLSQDGVPASQKKIDAWVEGAITTTPITDEVTETEQVSLQGGWNATLNGVPTSEWYGVTYGDGKFVAVAISGTDRVMYSSDGVNWAASGSGVEASEWRGVTYADGKFVAVAQDGTNRVMTSSDGINWSPTSNGVEASEWYSVTYGDGKFVAVGKRNAMYSSDGINWTKANIAGGGEGNAWGGVTYGDGKFVAVAYNGSKRAMYSTDGINWTTTTSGDDTSGWISVTYGAGTFVAVEYRGAVSGAMYSTDGINWTALGTAEGVPQAVWWSVTYAAGTFVAVATQKGYGDGQVMTSRDGKTWTVTSNGVSNSSWRGVIYGGDRFVAVADTGSSNQVMWSYTGTGEDAEQEKLTFTSDQELALFEPGDAVETVETDRFVEPLESFTDDSITKTWSTFLSASNGFYQNKYTANCGFGAGAGIDSNSTSSGAYATSNLNGTLNFDCSTFPLSGQIEWVTTNTGAYSFTVTHSGGVDTITPESVQNQQYNNSFFFSYSGIRNIFVKYSGDIGGTALRGIRVNGTVLIDGQRLATKALNFAAGTDMSALAGGDVITSALVPKPYNFSDHLSAPDAGFYSGNGADKAFKSNPAETDYAATKAPLQALVLNIPPGAITSPTFTVIGRYAANTDFEIVHEAGTAFVSSNFTLKTWNGYSTNCHEISGFNNVTRITMNAVKTGPGEYFTTLYTIYDGSLASLPASGGGLKNGDLAPQPLTGVVGSIAGTTVTLASGDTDWVNGEDVIGPVKRGTGTVASVDVAAKTMNLNDRNNTPIVVGNHIAGPVKTLDSVRRYLKFDSNGSVTDLLGQPQSPPYTTTDVNPGLTLKFPSTFPSGATPDDEIAEGAILTAQCFVTNSAGSSGPLQDTVQPEGPSQPNKYSDFMTSSNGWYAGGYTPDKAFGAGEGIASNSTGAVYCSTAANGTLTFDSSTFPLSGVVEWVGARNDYKFTVTHDGGESEITASTQNASFNFTYILNFSGITKVVLIPASGTSGGIAVGCRGIKVNGEVLLDAEYRPTRSLTEEELKKHKALFLTYDNRKSVKQGEDAMARRAELTDQLKQAGLELPEF